LRVTNKISLLTSNTGGVYNNFAIFGQ